jgi:phytoene dehydrogenase-like protein
MPHHGMSMARSAAPSDGPRRRILIVGAGLAGLAAAREIAASGHDPIVLEATDRVGGRCTSDVLDGFTLDRGFQVYLTAYREGRRLVDPAELEPRPFYPGATLHDGGRAFTVAHPLRHPLQALLGGLRGGFRVGELRALTALALRAARSDDEAAGTLGISSRRWLEDLGLGRSTIERFFRPFFGGVFLDRSMETDAGRMLHYLGCFAAGETVVPSRGMRALPEAIAAALPADSVRLGRPVVALHQNRARLADGSVEEADAMVLATDMSAAARLFPELPTLPWQPTVTAWFATDDPRVGGAMLHLNAGRGGAVNHAANLAAVAPSYAPPGRGLFCANVVGVAQDLLRGVSSERELAGELRRQLAQWLPRQGVERWELLRVDRIDRAIPRQHPADLAAVRPTVIDGIFLAGDHVADASINGALRSGRLAAERAIASLTG